MSAQWVAGAGVHDLKATIDPGNTLGEDASTATNNASPTLRADVTPFVNEKLSYAKAWAAGARFADNVESFSWCSMGQRESTAETVSFQGNCGGAPGNKADPEAFIGFNLANGWRVLRADLVRQDGCTSGGGGCQVLSLPARGTRNPYMKMHIWANTGGVVFSLWSIWIEGPQCYSPYVTGQKSC